jgi:hypothetical protein
VIEDAPYSFFCADTGWSLLADAGTARTLLVTLPVILPVHPDRTGARTPLNRSQSASRGAGRVRTAETGVQIRR